jgi:hypothetical protein
LSQNDNIQKANITMGKEIITLDTDVPNKGKPTAKRHQYFDVILRGGIHNFRGW